MKNPERCAADRDLNTAFQQERNTSNLPDYGIKSNDKPPLPCELARRDAKAMVRILNKLRSGLEPYECIYASLKKLHGESFEYHFRQILCGRDSSDG